MINVTKLFLISSGKHSLNYDQHISKTNMFGKLLHEVLIATLKKTMMEKAKTSQLVHEI